MKEFHDCGDEICLVCRFCKGCEGCECDMQLPKDDEERKAE